MEGNDNRSGRSSSGPDGLPGLPGCSGDSLGPPNVVDADGVDAVVVDLERDARVELPNWMFRSGSLMGATVALGA